MPDAVWIARKNVDVLLPVTDPKEKTGRRRGFDRIGIGIKYHLVGETRSTVAQAIDELGDVVRAESREFCSLNK